MYDVTQLLSQVQTPTLFITVDFGDGNAGNATITVIAGDPIINTNLPNELSLNVDTHIYLVINHVYSEPGTYSMAINEKYTAKQMTIPVTISAS